MKIRLSEGKINLRISEIELQILKNEKKLNEKFWISSEVAFDVSLRLSDLTTFESTVSGFIVTIKDADIILQRNKKDAAFSIPVSENLILTIDVDLLTREKIKPDVVVGQK